MYDWKGPVLTDLIVRFMTESLGQLGQKLNSDALTEEQRKIELRHAVRIWREFHCFLDIHYPSDPLTEYDSAAFKRMLRKRLSRIRNPYSNEHGDTLH